MRHKDMILVAAAELDRDYDGDDFTIENLAIESWKRYPDAFGLRGYPYPDSSKVFAKVCDLVALGFLERTRASHIVITKIGRRKADELVRVHAIESARSNESTTTKEEPRRRVRPVRV